MEFRPVDFLREVRTVTKEHGTALIFDEVITGFRMHPGGAQALFGIKADIATYGKVIGGGMPIGAMIGSRPWMDALDGGPWQFGDDSVPESGVTYFAGTFVRHPLTMAAAKAVLVHMKEEGPRLQERLNGMTEDMVKRANGLFDRYRLPYRWVNFGSAFKTKYDESVGYTELFFMLMRHHGVHVLDFPHFLTTAHSEGDVERIIEAVEKTCQELRASGFMPERTYPIEVVNSTLNGTGRNLRERVVSADSPPLENARMGRMPNGDAAWFVPDPLRAGKYLMLEGEEL
jgi:glutamate-1-semialdehyde aminotransferase